LLEEKETLYKQHSEIVYTLEPSRDSSDSAEESEADSGDFESRNLREKRGAGQESEQDLAALESELESKLKQYEDLYGKEPWYASITSAFKKAGGTLRVLNPFEKESLADKTNEELLGLNAHYEEKVRLQRDLVETLNSAFDRELAIQEQVRMMKDLDVDEHADIGQIRKDIKEVEKNIRSRYQDIDDRHNRKKGLLEELDGLVGEKQKPFLQRAVTAPVRVPYRAVRAFIFGLPNEEVELTEAAENSDSLRAEEIKEEIEFESLLIQAQSREIGKLEKDLEILKAKASLAGGYKFRSSLVKVPYLFLDEAIDRAEELVDPEERKELILEKLDESTRELEAARRELAAVSEELEERQLSQGSEVEEAIDSFVGKFSGVSDQERQSLKREIEELHQKVKSAQAKQDERREAGQVPVSDEQSFSPARTHQDLSGKIDEKMSRELADIEKAIVEVVNEQIKLDQREIEIYEKRLEKADKLLKEIASTAQEQDVIRERERMEARILQLNSRRELLFGEQNRFAVRSV